MNLKQKINKVAGRTPEIVIIVLILLAGFGAYSYVTDNADTEDQVNQTDQNKTDINVSKYYNNETQTCDSPDINQTNASELKQCVTNQTPVN